jgi:hypothetical protein
MKRPNDHATWDELTPPTPEELEQARALREALESDGDHPDAELCRALRAAYDPAEIEPRAHEWIVKRAVLRTQPKRRAKIVALFATGTALALAAGVVLVLSGGVWSHDAGDHDTLATASLVRSRSTQPLFDAPFARHGGNSERMDRIASARGKDFRTNRFARMGVKP